MIDLATFIGNSVYYMGAKPKDIQYLHTIYEKIGVSSDLDSLKHLKEEHLHEFFLRYTPMEVFYMLTTGRYELFYNPEDEYYYLVWS
ncbi:MAG: hypothetical protein ABS939_02640 [Psychrobacillus sp.]